MIWVQFVTCTALIVVAAGTLSRYGDVLAEKTGLGRTWMGAVVLAGATSLPELVSGTSAVAWLDAPNLAVGSIFGSCLFNLALIAIMDLAYQPGLILGVGVTSLIIVITQDAYRFNWDGVALLGMYGFAMIMLYIMA